MFAGESNHLKACPLHGIGPNGGKCGSSFIALLIYSPKYCGARGSNTLEGRGLGERPRLIFNIHQHSICRGRLLESHLHPSSSYAWTTVCSSGESVSGVRTAGQKISRALRYLSQASQLWAHIFLSLWLVLRTGVVSTSEHPALSNIRLAAPRDSESSIYIKMTANCCLLLRNFCFPA